MSILCLALVVLRHLKDNLDEIVLVKRGRPNYTGGSGSAAAYGTRWVWAIFLCSE